MGRGIRHGVPMNAIEKPRTKKQKRDLAARRKAKTKSQQTYAEMQKIWNNIPTPTPTEPILVIEDGRRVWKLGGKR